MTPEALCTEYRRVAQSLWAELTTHQHNHGCVSTFDVPRGCEVKAILRTAWLEAESWAEAVEWLLLGKVPLLHRHDWREFLGPALPAEGHA